VKSRNSSNCPLFDEVTADVVHQGKQKFVTVLLPTYNILKSDIWVRSTFTISLKQISDTDLANDEFLDLRNNEKLRFDFELVKLDRFWCELGEAYTILTKRAYHTFYSRLSQPTSEFLVHFFYQDQSEEQTKS
jgi:hypothetical protein